MPESKTSSAVSRRTLVQGAAWAVPAVAFAGAAPAYAASPAVTPAFRLYAYRSATNGWCATMRLSTERDGNGTAGDGNVYLCWDNTTTANTFTNVSVTYWIAEPNITWAAYTGSSCWTVPTSTGAKRTQNGVTLYAYKSTLTCAVTAANGRTCLPEFDWYTPNCVDQISATWGYHVDWTMNGSAQSWEGFGALA